MENINEIKQLVIADVIADGYQSDKATKDVEEEATILQEGNTITVTYISGAIDRYEIELVKRLKFIK